MPKYGRRTSEREREALDMFYNFPCKRFFRDTILLTKPKNLIDRKSMFKSNKLPESQEIQN